MWAVEYTDEFGAWFDGNELNETDREALAESIGLLEHHGPTLGRPHADTVKGARHRNLKELRTRNKEKVLRTFFAIDPRRRVILLIGGNKWGDKRFYERMIPEADRLYSFYLEEIRKEGLI